MHIGQPKFLELLFEKSFGRQVTWGTRTANA
jgi:hypothetical protein